MNWKDKAIHSNLLLQLHFKDAMCYYDSVQ